MPAIKLGELLVKANVLQEAQLRTALSQQSRWGGRLGDVLVRMALVTEDLLVRALSKQLGTPVANLDGIESLQGKVLEKLTAEQSRKLQAIPLQLKDDGKTLIVAMCEPQNLEQVDTLRSVTGCRIMTQLTGRSAFLRAYRRFYDDSAPLALESALPILEDAPGEPREVTGSGIRDLTILQDGPLDLAGPGAEPITAPTRLDELSRQEPPELRAMLELLVEKGVFTREEFLAKLRRPS